MIVDNFDEMTLQSRSQPLVMGIALHPYLVGQPYRLRHLAPCADAPAQVRARMVHYAWRRLRACSRYADGLTSRVAACLRIL